MLIIDYLEKQNLCFSAPNDSISAMIMCENITQENVISTRVNVHRTEICGMAKDSWDFLRLVARSNAIFESKSANST